MTTVVERNYITLPPEPEQWLVLEVFKPSQWKDLKPPTNSGYVTKTTQFFTSLERATEAARISSRKEYVQHVYLSKVIKSLHVRM